MLKKKFLKIALSGIVLTSIIASPLSLNLSSFNSTANAEQPMDVLSVVSSNAELESKIETIKETKKDETLDNLREKINRNALKVNTVKYSGKFDKENNILRESTDIAANVSDVRKDSELQKFLQSAIQQGKRVYIYGGLTVKEYKELLNIDEIKITQKDSRGKQGYVRVGSDSKQSNKKFNDEKTSIIGFTLDEQEQMQYVEINVTSYDEEGNVRENDEEALIQDILVEQAEVIKKNENAKHRTAFFLTQKASASNQVVAEKYGYYGLAKDSNNVTIGRVDTDFILYQESSDGSSTYDHFTLEPATQITDYNGAVATKLRQNLPVGGELKKWSPEGDTSGNSYEVSLGFPYTISFTMGFSDSVTIDDQSSLASDYARWVMTDSNLDGEVFRGVAGWADTGSVTTCSIDSEGTVMFGPSNQYPAVASKTVNITYDY